MSAFWDLNLFLGTQECPKLNRNLFDHFPIQDYRRKSHCCKTWKDCKALFEQSHRSCPLSTIRKFFWKIDRQHSAYKLGLKGAEAQRAMKKY
jgi:hypothetical protein